MRACAHALLSGIVCLQAPALRFAVSAGEDEFRQATGDERDRRPDHGVPGPREIGAEDDCRHQAQPGDQAEQRRPLRHVERGHPLHAEETIAKSRNIKAFICDVMVADIGQAMDILGVYGSDRAYDVEKHWRDVKMIQLWLGGKQLCQAEAVRYYYNCETI